MFYLYDIKVSIRALIPFSINHDHLNRKTNMKFIFLLYNWYYYLIYYDIK